MSAVLSDPALDAALHREGYVPLPLLDSGQVAHLLADIAELGPGDGFAPDGTGRAGNTYHCSFLDPSKAYKRAAFELLCRHFADAVDRHLAGFRIVTANFYVKPPGRGDLRIHQNWPVLDLEETSVTIWCPLVDVDETNGTLQVVPRSHKLVPHVEAPTSPSYFSAFIDRVPDYMIALPSPAGSGFVFDDSLVHGSPPNGGAAPRIAAQLICIPARARPIFYFRDDATRFERIAAEPDFYLDQDLSEIVERQPGWQGVGHVESRNRLLTEDEFANLLAARGWTGRRQLARPGQDRNATSLARPVKERVRSALARILPGAVKRILRRMLGPTLPS